MSELGICLCGHSGADHIYHDEQGGRMVCQLCACKDYAGIDT